MDKGIVAAASIMTLFSLYFAYSPEATQEYFAKKGKQTLVIRGDGEDVKIKPLRGIRWKEVSADDPQISFESTIVFTGTKSNAKVVTPEKTEVSLDQQTIASFIIKNQVEGLELQKGYLSIKLRGGKFTVFGKRPMVITGKGEVKLDKTQTGVKISPQNGEITVVEEDKTEVITPTLDIVIEDKDTVKLISPKQYETFITLDKQQVTFEWSEQVNQFTVLKLTDGKQEKVIERDKIQQETFSLSAGQYIWSAAAVDQNWDGKIEVIRTEKPVLEINYTDQADERIFQVVDINGGNPYIESTSYEGLSSSGLSLLLKETRSALQFSSKDYPELTQLKTYFNYIGSKKGPVEIYNVPLKPQVSEVESKVEHKVEHKAESLPKPVEDLKVEQEQPQPEVKEIAKEVPKKKIKKRKKRYKDYVFYPYAISGMDAFFSTQLRNNAKSTTISSPFLGVGGILKFRKIPKNYIDLRIYYNKILETDTRDIKQDQKINLASEFKLYQHNIMNTEVNYYLKYTRHSYLKSADPEEINFGIQNLFMLGAGFSPAVTQDFWIFQDNLIYLYYVINSDGDRLDPVLEFESVLKSLEVYKHKFTPFVEMGIKSLNGSDYDQMIYSFFVGSYF